MGQPTFTLHKPPSKMFPSNQNTVTNIVNDWEIDLTDLGSLSKYIGKHKYLLNVIDIYSNYGRRETL
jgi:hypothetical protein